MKKLSNTKAELKKSLAYEKSLYLYSVVNHYFQIQSFADVLQNRCSSEFCNIHRKTPMLESLFNKVAGLRTAFFIVHQLKEKL